MPTTAVITRFHYDVHDPGARFYASPEQFEWRFNFFASMCLPRIKQQSGEFDIWIWCEDEHRERFERLGCRTFNVLPEYRTWVRKGHENKDISLPIAGRTSKLHIDFIPWEAVVGMPQYDLQISIDSDELLLRKDTFEVIRKYLCYLDKSAHVSFQYTLFDVLGCQLYTSPFRYSADRGSAFYALWQPDTAPENYVFALDDSHFNIGHRMQHRFFIGEDQHKSFVAASVHPWNSSTRLPVESKPFMQTNKSWEATQ